MKAIKARLIDKINKGAGDSPKASRLKLRGRDVSEASDKAVTASLPSGRTESYAWQQLNAGERRAAGPVVHRPRKGR